MYKVTWSKEQNLARTPQCPLRIVLPPVPHTIEQVLRLEPEGHRKWEVGLLSTWSPGQCWHQRQIGSGQRDHPLAHPMHTESSQAWSIVPARKLTMKVCRPSAIRALPPVAPRDFGLWSLEVYPGQVRSGGRGGVQLRRLVS